jgi:tetratricopeptide (TPR) repeat protein
MPELDGEFHARIVRLGEEGDELAKVGKDPEALDKYYEAWELVPDPKQDWECSTWILSSMGELYLKHKKYDKAQHAFQSAVQCPDGLGNPYLHLRLGEIYFEKNAMDDAADELTRAYMGAGEDIFKAEDPKYLAFLRTKLQPPAGS